MGLLGGKWLCRGDELIPDDGSAATSSRDGAWRPIVLATERGILGRDCCVVFP